MWQSLILLCKLTSFQKDKNFGGNHQESTFSGAQTGLWDGRTLATVLFFLKEGGKYF